MCATGTCKKSGGNVFSVGGGGGNGDKSSVAQSQQHQQHSNAKHINRNLGQK